MSSSNSNSGTPLYVTTEPYEVIEYIYLPIPYASQRENSTVAVAVHLSFIFPSHILLKTDDSKWIVSAFTSIHRTHIVHLYLSAIKTHIYPLICGYVHSCNPSLSLQKSSPLSPYIMPPIVRSTPVNADTTKLAPSMVTLTTLLSLIVQTQTLPSSRHAGPVVWNGVTFQPQLFRTKVMGGNNLVQSIDNAVSTLKAHAETNAEQLPLSSSSSSSSSSDIPTLKISGDVVLTRPVTADVCFTYTVYNPVDTFVKDMSVTPQQLEQLVEQQQQQQQQRQPLEQQTAPSVSTSSRGVALCSLCISTVSPPPCMGVGPNWSSRVTQLFSEYGFRDTRVHRVNEGNGDNSGGVSLPLPVQAVQKIVYFSQLLNICSDVYFIQPAPDSIHS